MDSFLHDFVNEFEALGTAGTGFARVDFPNLEALDLAQHLIYELGFAYLSL
jgi:hypothetical protein